MKRDRVGSLHFAVKRFWHRIGQALARGGTNLRNKLGQGDRPERVRPSSAATAAVLTLAEASFDVSTALSARRELVGDPAERLARRDLDDGRRAHALDGRAVPALGAEEVVGRLSFLRDGKLRVQSSRGL